MPPGDPEPQTEQIHELILTGAAAWNGITGPNTEHLRRQAADPAKRYLQKAPCRRIRLRRPEPAGRGLAVYPVYPFQQTFQDREVCIEKSVVNHALHTLPTLPTARCATLLHYPRPSLLAGAYHIHSYGTGGAVSQSVRTGAFIAYLPEIVDRFDVGVI
jgi:hypothetical protein